MCACAHSLVPRLQTTATGMGMRLVHAISEFLAQWMIYANSDTIDTMLVKHYYNCCRLKPVL